MPSAIGDGWVLALLALFISIAIPLMRLVGSKWKESRDQVVRRAEKAEAENQVLKSEAVKRTEEKYSLQVEVMLLKTKLEICENNLDNWESGRWGSK